MGDMGIHFLRIYRLTQKLQGKEGTQQKEEKAFYVSILPSVLKTTANTHFMIKVSTFLS